MDTEIDWQHELDRSFGAGEDRPPAHYVVVGHGAVRRRRAAAVVLTASIVLGGTAAWAVSPGSSPRGEAPVATQGPAPADEDASGGEEQRQDRRRSLEELRRAGEARVDFLGNPAALADGGLVLAPRSGPVLERVPNPMGYTPAQGSSLAIRVMFRGRETYSLMAAFPDSTSTMTNDASGDFQGWLAGVVASQRTLDVANGVTPSSGDTSDASDAPWLALAPDGSVRAASSDVVLTEVRSDVDLGPAFADGATRTGAVRALVDGRTVYAVFRVVDGALDVVPGGGRFESMSAFLSWARDQYASGQGLR